MPLRVGQEIQEVLRRGDGELTPTSSPDPSTTFGALDTIPGEGDHMNLAGVVQQLRKERDQAARTVEQLDAALAALTGVSGKRTGTRRKISAAGRARIAAAQRARWAKVRRNGGQKQNVVSMPKKTMSAAARRKIASAQRARWARVKAVQKKSA